MLYGDMTFLSFFFFSPIQNQAPDLFQPIQNLDLFQAVIYDSRGVFGGGNILLKYLKNAKKRKLVSYIIQGGKKKGYRDKS